MTSCVEWEGQRKPNGYGYIDLYESGDGTRRRVYAHRAAINAPDGAIVRHLCHNPSCVNPEHLKLGTQADNSDDMVRANRSTARIKYEHVGVIRACVAAGVSTSTLARMFDVSPSAIRRAAAGKSFRSASGTTRRRADRGEHHLNARLTETNVRDIRASAAAGERQVDIARRLGVTPQAINLIVHRKAWRHVP